MCIIIIPRALAIKNIKKDMTWELFKWIIKHSANLVVKKDENMILKCDNVCIDIVYICV
jgi:hypothetical protein